MKYSLLFFTTTIILFSSCGAEKKTEENLSDFDTFYERFHTDSIYQVEHITFPLEGLPSGADSTTIVQGAFRWKKENWVMHRPLDLESGNFERRFESLSDMLVTEYITEVQTRHLAVRRFARMNNEWFLIYYTGMNKTSK